MKPSKFSPENLFLYAVGALLCAWLGLLTAPYLEDGLASVIRNLDAAFAEPYRIQWCEYSLKAVFLFLLFLLYILKYLQLLQRHFVVLLNY